MIESFTSPSGWRVAEVEWLESGKMAEWLER